MLRALILCAGLASLAAPLQAEPPERPAPRFAPGALGDLGVPVDRMMEEAAKDAERLRSRLKPQAPADGAFEAFDFKAARDRALKNPRVRALLGADPQEMAPVAEAGDADRYGDARVFLFASFSMPDTALRDMMEEASLRGVPILFRGFVGNSVFDTRAALERVFGEAAQSPGFLIDPTFFARFDVDVVPQVIAVAGPLEVCETSGCEGDPAPPHDRVKGNVPLDFALQLIAREGDVAAGIARPMLEE
ncbi:type-F conjugative transfer system pilin assembly protein TrbC [Chachezhania sediminis]|uniref:type-F conjugative transfer system pilin assembly protein TrbC n=1 Tax=Chachezhania sediminis TaxID=2599291 RepID=UPI001E522FA8|nr:type-F conjugative transfer system pilin assembly protein TrbC [Chachezhania sediminis]